MVADINFLNNVSAQYIGDLYAHYLEDKSQIDESWASFFDDLGDNHRGIIEELTGASWTPKKQPAQKPAPANTDIAPDQQNLSTEELSIEQLRAAAMDSVRALMLVRAYRVRGHLEADLDPLNLWKREDHPELDPLSYGFSHDDFNRPIFINGVLGRETATLNEIVAICRKTYCGHIGVEFMHIQDPDVKSWIQERIESDQNQTEFTKEGKAAILERLSHAEGLETFLQTKYTGTKRFGLDGGEALIPAFEQVMKRGSQLGLQEVVIGMAHRGRLNMLTTVMHKPYRALFSEFKGGSAQPEDVQGAGDVKYHLGTSADREFDGKQVHLSLTANPSHLESVNPVVLGKVRAKQALLKDDERNKVMGILMHGDAAMAGQGIVGETFHLSELSGYTTGGTIHFVINNQIGFTTTPEYARSSPYPTDVAKMTQAPIFHVNGDDPEAVVYVARIATEFRMKFKRDVVVDIICYRRHGHNEGDEPSFTQPVMYKKIKSHPTTKEIYAEKLATEGSLPKESSEAMDSDFRDRLEQEFEAADDYKPEKADMLEGEWKDIELAESESKPRRGETGVDLKTLKEIGHTFMSAPDDFALNSKIKRQFDKKREIIDDEGEIDWAMAEQLAFGALLNEGKQVRLTGQDCGRGTFSQRHAILYDQENGDPYIPLQNLPNKDQGMFTIIDSPLSEYAVLGYEYGHAMAEPHGLTLWEAQFGDFVNGAQVIIDQYITSGESKWFRMNGLVMLLPHGYEGQGPEHSSARLERFLQACAEDNIQVANCTTPANYFHILRRQIHRKFRKPLIIMTPKSLLRHKLCVSPLKDLGPKTTFHRILDEREIDLAEPDKIKRLVLCSGKVYYDLYQAREEAGIKHVTIVRLEQLYPVPETPLKELFEYFPKAEVVWCQEEPENMGAWSFLDRKLEQLLSDVDHVSKRPIYVGRDAAASPATGVHKRHVEEQERLVNEALGIKKKKA